MPTGTPISHAGGGGDDDQRQGLGGLLPVAEIDDQQQRDDDQERQLPRAVQRIGAGGEQHHQEQRRDRLQQVDEALDDEAERPGDGIEDEGGVVVEQIDAVADPLAERDLVVLEPFHALLLGPACRPADSRQRQSDLAGGAFGRPACWEMRRRSRAENRRPALPRRLAPLASLQGSAITMGTNTQHENRCRHPGRSGRGLRGWRSARCAGSSTQDPPRSTRGRSS